MIQEKMPLEEFQNDDHLGYQNKIQNEFTILNLHIALMPQIVLAQSVNMVQEMSKM